MIRSFAFTTAGKLHTKDIDLFLMPSLLVDTNLFLWVDLENATPDEARQILENVFHFHPLSIEDCIHDSPAPKVEAYEPKEDDRFAAYLFIVIHGVDYNRKDSAFATSELNFFLGKNFLVTYHNVPMRSITLVEERCLKSTLPVARAPDRVAHVLLDTLVDNYKPALEELSEEISGLDELVLKSATPDTLERVLKAKKEVQHLRKIIGPQREVLARFARGEFKLIRPHLVPYYRDVYDGLDEISSTAQGYTDTLSGILQTYLNVAANQQGEVVKVLTMITILTTPATIIASWYGMNFKFMNELEWKHGYAYVLTLTVVSTLGTLVYFKQKKWL
jgi:magnesium transporter